jgi:hypothetical protein
MELSRLAADRGEGYVMMSLPEFFALPLVERIRLILRQRLLFYDETASLIPLAEGIRLLKLQQPTE